jgi:mono/diheme cytochrome c family protein
MRNQRPTFSYLKFLGSAIAVAVAAWGADTSSPPSVSKQAPTHAVTASPAHPASTAPFDERAFLKQNCQTCHNAKLQTAGLALDTVDLGDIPASGETLEKVIRKVWSGTMPPAQMPRPDASTRNLFLTSLETRLDAAAVAHPNPGRPTMLHRLNRTEYLNAVHDLLDVDLSPDEAALLPADDLSYGFDNNGDVLGVPPLLLERYLSVARRVSMDALGSAAKTEGPVNVYTQTVDSEPSQRKWMEGMPLGTRGGANVTYHFPADGEYTVKITLQRRGGGIVGFPNQNQAPSDEPPPRERIVLNLDGKPVGLFLIGGDLTLRETIPASPASGQSLADLPEPPVKELSRADLAARRLNGDEGLQVQLVTKAGDRQLTAAFLARYVAVPSQLREPFAAGQGSDARPMGIYGITITGPIHSEGPGETLSRHRILTCRPATPAEEVPCARTILDTLAHSAYRRPVTPAEMQELLTAYERGRKGGDFESGFQLALRRILMDPAFLFRIERDPAGLTPGTPYRLSDLELASRLAFFLWSGPPDAELLTVAQKGQLTKDPAILEHQVRRMLADPRAQSLVANFASEWLGLRIVKGVLPDPIIFSDFEGLKQAFQRETELFLDNVLLGDRNVLELLNANYTFLNERLARHYGIQGVYGNQFRKVTVTDGIRGGLLGQGGILTATSYPNRTSPVLRGQWILNNILGSPAPPPPPNVPRLDDEANANVLSMRERMAQHRANPACAGCHARMDPLGLALENFDATGKWRVGERLSPADLKLQPIDAAGELTDGTRFEGVAGLKRVLQNHSEEFVYNMTERLLIYALGRGSEWYDAPVIRAAVRTAKKDDYHFSSLVLSIVKSTPFQMRVSLDADTVKAEASRQPRMTAALSK